MLVRTQPEHERHLENRDVVIVALFDDVADATVVVVVVVVVVAAVAAAALSSSRERVGDEPDLVSATLDCGEGENAVVILSSP